MTAGEAIDAVKAKRGIINPNSGFRVQLASYAERYVGNRAQGQNGVSDVSRTRSAKISNGIAARIRRFKGETIVASSSAIALAQVESEENPSEMSSLDKSHEMYLSTNEYF